MPIASITSEELVSRIDAAWDAGRGGWVVTANLDVLRYFLLDPIAREAYLQADLRVADGMPLVWASRLQKCPIPERVAGSSLCRPLIELCASRGRPVMLLGGSAGTAERAAQMYRDQLPELCVYANSALRFSPKPDLDELDAARQVLRECGAQLVLVGLGSPKQELVIGELRKDFPGAWFVGVGGSFSFITGDVKRAPLFMQRVGLEWVHRLVQDPSRLGPRYLKHDLPVAFRLLLEASKKRWLYRDVTRVIR